MVEAVVGSNPVLKTVNSNQTLVRSSAGQELQALRQTPEKRHFSLIKNQSDQLCGVEKGPSADNQELSD